MATIRNLRIIVTITVISAFNAGCASSQVYQLDYEPVAADKFTIVDQRNVERKKSKILSLNISNCAYGIYRIGDTQLQPERMVYLNERLSAALADRDLPAQIVVPRFDVYLNRQVYVREFAGAVSPAGLVGDIVIDRACKTKYGDEAGYSADENPTGLDAGITHLAVDINGTNYAARGLALVPRVEPGAPHDRDKLLKMQSDAIKESIDIAIDEILNQVVQHGPLEEAS